MVLGMLSFRDSLKHFKSLPREQLGRSMVLMRLCKEAKEESKKTTDASKLEGLDRFVEMVCQYIKHAAEEHKKGSGNNAEEGLKKIRQFLKEEAHNLLPSHAEALEQLKEAEKGDAKAEKSRKSQLEQIRKEENEGKSKRITLLFPGNGTTKFGDDIVTSVFMKVTEKTTSTALAAMVYYYDKTRENRLKGTARFVHFYKPDGQVPLPNPWDKGKLPEQLFAIVDRGKFEFRIPNLLEASSTITSQFFVFRNLLKLQGIRYLKEAHGTLRPHTDLKSIPQVNVQRIAEGQELSSEEYNRWSPVLDLIHSKDARDGHWVVSSPVVTPPPDQHEAEPDPIRSTDTHLPNPPSPVGDPPEVETIQCNSPNVPSAVDTQATLTRTSSEESFKTAMGSPTMLEPSQPLENRLNEPGQSEEQLDLISPIDSIPEISPPIEDTLPLDSSSTPTVIDQQGSQHNHNQEQANPAQSTDPATAIHPPNPPPPETPLSDTPTGELLSRTLINAQTAEYRPMVNPTNVSWTSSEASRTLIGSPTQPIDSQPKKETSEPKAKKHGLLRRMMFWKK